MDKQNKNIHIVTFLLLVVGGLNWLLIGLFNLNVVEYLGSSLAQIVYILVGASAVYEFVMHKSTCKVCASSGGSKDVSHSHDSSTNHSDGQGM